MFFFVLLKSLLNSSTMKYNLNCLCWRDISAISILIDVRPLYKSLRIPKFSVKFSRKMFCELTESIYHTSLPRRHIQLYLCASIHMQRKLGIQQIVCVRCSRSYGSRLILKQFSKTCFVSAALTFYFFSSQIIFVICSNHFLS